MPNSTSSPAEWIKARSKALGFEAVGITDAAAIPEAPKRLEEFLENGRHGSMEWMKDRADQRGAPVALWDEVKSVIVVGQNYGPKKNPLPDLERRERGIIAAYAKGKDYHDVLKKRLKRLAREIVETHEGDVKVFVDTAPVMEKPLAEAAGLGWQGKHTNLVSTDLGAWLFLGVIYTTLELPKDQPHEDRCGTCRDCLDICPTAAFPAPYQLDARRCISYLTIEHKGHIPEEFRAPMGNRIYGCDDCIAVCPWNKFATRASEAAYHARIELRKPELKDLVTLDDAAFREFFSGSPIKRTGRDRFVRNVLIAIGNSGMEGLVPLVHDRLNDTSPLVRAMAVWALGQLVSTSDLQEARERYLQNETDGAVIAEWG